MSTREKIRLIARAPLCLGLVRHLEVTLILIDMSAIQPVGLFDVICLYHFIR